MKKQFLILFAFISVLALSQVPQRFNKVIVTGDITSPKFIKTGSTADSVLLGNGSARPINSLKTDTVSLSNRINAKAAGNGTANGTNTGDETLTSIKTKLGAATSVSDGYLKYQDFVRFDGKQPAGSYLTTETDPTIYAWAKASTKPSYAYSEITSKPTNLSQFTNDLGNYGGFVTGTPWTAQGYITESSLTPYSLTTHTHSYLPLSGGTLSGGLTINSTSLKIVDALTLGLASEVSGQIIDFGTNFNQLGNRDVTKAGGFFRIDTRPTQISEFFSIKYIPANGGETNIFKVSTDGTLTSKTYNRYDGNTMYHSGNLNPILNQNSSAQSANMWINGTINATNYIGKSNGFYTVQITQAAYNALGTKDASTIYMIVG